MRRSLGQGLCLEAGCLHNTRMILETRAADLDTWQTSDWTAFRHRDGPQVMRYITGGVPWTDDQIRSFVERQVKL